MIDMDKVVAANAATASFSNGNTAMATLAMGVSPTEKIDRNGNKDVR